MLADTRAFVLHSRQTIRSGTGDGRIKRCQSLSDKTEGLRCAGCFRRLLLGGVDLVGIALKGVGRMRKFGTSLKKRMKNPVCRLAGFVCRMQWLVIFPILVLGCSRNDAPQLVELKPETLDELLLLSPDELERVDTGRMNLLCCEWISDPATGRLDKAMARLDDWTERVWLNEKRRLPHFQKFASRYDNSLAKYKAVNLALAIQRELKCGYNMSLVRSGAMQDVRTPRFFRHSDDVFISGLLRTGKGSCSSMPVLFVTLARRLGYPVRLAMTRHHLYCRWEDGRESFNMEISGEGVDDPSDDFYRGPPFSPSEDEIRGEGLLRSLTNKEALGVFLETAGLNREANNDLPHAVGCYVRALRCRPNSRYLSRLLEHAQRKR